MKRSKQDLLDELKARILADKVCQDLASQATQLVFADGSPEAELVFIGEAPGKNEDLQGLPFVGAAGKFLNKMLASIGLERKDIYNPAKANCHARQAQLGRPPAWA
jgi:DNA polymerase